PGRFHSRPGIRQTRPQKMSGASDRNTANLMIGKIFHFIANRAASLFMKLLFGYSSRIYVVGCEHLNRAGGFLLASNHISHFDPLIISSVLRREFVWLPMAECFPLRVLRHFLRSVDGLPS